jgi:DNA-binding MarR family transcriptional regulator
MAFLLSQVGARTAQLFAAQIAPLGITPRAFAILSNLGARQPQTQQQLADGLGIHRNNMVSLIDELEASGWVRRHRSPDDRRAFEIHLTTAGREVVTQVNALVVSLNEELAGALAPAERAAFTSQLTRIAQSLELESAIHPHVAGRAHASPP